MPALRRLGGFTLALLFLVGFTPLVNLWAYWLGPARSDAGGGSAEAIVVLGAGGVTAAGVLTDASLRGTVEGIMLYRRGIAPLVVFSGSRADGAPDEASARATLARDCGLPGPAILTSSTARTTREEAVHIRALLAARGIDRVMLVADAAGLPRAMRTFERVGFTVIADPSVGALDLGGGPEDRLNLLRQIAIESIARVYYRLAGFL
jgi:uncharacterized SAM-binding protein YcdF (DUF218 family)